MDTVKQWYIFSVFVNTFVLSFATLYVSQNGSDIESCGISEHTACGTLHFASGLLNIDQTEIYVIDGQNEQHISGNINLSNHTYHPCLPMLQKNLNNITISFDEGNIKTMLNWYPQMCINYDINNTLNENKYMFEAEKIDLTINNLQIDLNPYNGHTYFGIINVVNEEKLEITKTSSFTCNNCKFANIDNRNDDINMVYSTTDITFTNTKFRNIQSINDFMVMGSKNLESSFAINNVSVENCIFTQSFIHIQNTIKYDRAGNQITLNNSQFINISSNNWIIFDENIQSKLRIFDVQFININFGGIYHAIYQYKSSVVMRNILVSTSQLKKDILNITRQSLFQFLYPDNIEIENILVQYNYDIFSNCYF
eukprot:183893_1